MPTTPGGAVAFAANAASAFSAANEVPPLVKNSGGSSRSTRITPNPRLHPVPTRPLRRPTTTSD